MLVAARAPLPEVGYVDQLVGDDSAGRAPAGIRFQFRDALRQPYDADVIHLTTIDAVVGGARVAERERRRRAVSFARAVKREGVALVRTIFPDARAVSPAHAILDRATTAFVVLHPTTAAPTGGTTRLIP
ncbi:MAG: hypothetical protein QM602_01150, partial [Microbacterium sp.]